MLSFINIMGGKNPLDDPEDEESTEGGEGKKKVEVKGFMSWSDALVLLLIIGGIIGGYKYYQYTKKKSAETFARCALLFDGGDFAVAKDCYESTWGLSYAPADLDSIRVVRLGAIEDMKVSQEYVLETTRTALQGNDTVAAIKAMKSFQGPILLNEDDAEEWKSLQTAFASAMQDSVANTVKDSTAAK